MPEVVEPKPSRVIINHPTSGVSVRRENASLHGSWPQMIFDKHVCNPWLFALSSN